MEYEKEIQVGKGEFVEGWPWFIRTQTQQRVDRIVEPCKHCYDFRDLVQTRIDGSTYKESVCCCPRVVVAQNEGGNNGTAVCLDCILEAAAPLGI